MPDVFAEAVPESPHAFNTFMGPRGIFVGEKVRLLAWYDPPELTVGEPVAEEISAEHRAFSTHRREGVLVGG